VGFLDDDPAKSACTAAENDCSLRGAITNANSNQDIDTIYFAVVGEIVINANGELPQLSTNLSINGPASKLLTVKRGVAAPPFRIFTVNSEKTVTIAGLTISGGLADEGGGVKNVGALTITACDIRDNRAIDGANADDTTGNLEAGRGGHGGAIYNSGSMTISTSLLTNNNAGNGGTATTNLSSGGRFVKGGGGGFGGAIFNSEIGSLVIRNSSFSDSIL